MTTERDILFESGPYWVKAATFGSGRFRPKSHGFEVYRSGITASVKVATIGYSGPEGLAKASNEATRRAAAERG